MNERILNLLEELLIESDAAIMALVQDRDKKYQDEPTLKNELKKVRANYLAGHHYQLKAKKKLEELKNTVKAQKEMEHTAKHTSSQKAQKEHDNAELNQGLRKKLETTYAKS
jgi:uncharacterized membrane protein YdfJ with MMPL/SSD domain